MLMKALDAWPVLEKVPPEMELRLDPGAELEKLEAEGPMLGEVLPLESELEEVIKSDVEGSKFTVEDQLSELLTVLDPGSMLETVLEKVLNGELLRLLELELNNDTTLDPDPVLEELLEEILDAIPDEALEGAVDVVFEDVPKYILERMFDPGSVLEDVLEVVPGATLALFSKK